MEKIEIAVTSRDTADRSKNLNEIRAGGHIPAVLYGHGKPESILLDERDFRKALRNKAGANALFTINLAGKASLSIIKEIQRGVLSHKPIHVDFQRVDVKEKLEVNVPTHVIGEAPGVKNSGGILEHISREIRVRCLPNDIPTSIDIDVSKLELGHGVKVQDITPPAGVEFVTTGDHIVVNIVAPKVEEVAPVPGAAVEGAAEPEVIAKGKKDEEGAEGAAAAPAAGGKPGAPAAGKPAAGAAAPAAKEEKKK